MSTPFPAPPTASVTSARRRLAFLESDLAGSPFDSPLLGPSVILSPNIHSLRSEGAGLMPEGCQLDASPRSTGSPWRACNLSPPRPTFTSPPHWRPDDLLYETVAPAWFSPERLSCVGPPTLSAEPVGLPCNREH